MQFDHIAIACESLAAGVARVEAALGAQLPPAVGRHALMGTCNRLLSLGGRDYLEVIAVDPEAPPPGRARWFGLDGFSGPPRIAGWVAAVADLQREALPGAGLPVSFERGPYHWQMALPEDAQLPFAGLQPAQICWQSPHPALALPQSGCALRRLILVSPEAAALRARLAGVSDPRLVVEPGAAPAIHAEIFSPHLATQAGVCLL